MLKKINKKRKLTTPWDSLFVFSASSDNAEKGSVDFLKFQSLLDGQVIEPPDAPESEEDVENALFKFKVPPPEKSVKIPKRKAEKKKKDDALSTSTRSSRSIAIARRKQAEKNLEKGTSGKFSEDWKKN